MTDNGNSSYPPTPEDGYDLPVYGLDNGLFYALHIPAVVCLATSLSCALTTMIISFRRHAGKSFFSWTKCSRIVVYLAVCDGMHNLAHISDHIQMIITKNHVRPKALCQMYGFMTLMFGTAQNILVAIVALNIFLMMYFGKNLYFGCRDWRIVFVTYVVPAAGAVVAASLEQFGPVGAFCLTDGVKGWRTYVAFCSIPLLIILVMNTVLYTLTWKKIRTEMRLICNNMGYKPPTANTSLKAARSMSLFVVAFFIQWFPAGVYGAWALFGNVHVAVFHIVTVFTNIGGILNLGVFLRLHWRNKGRKETLSATQSEMSTVSKQISKCPEYTPPGATNFQPPPTV